MEKESYSLGWVLGRHFLIQLPILPKHKANPSYKLKMHEGTYNHTIPE